MLAVRAREQVEQQPLRVVLVLAHQLTVDGHVQRDIPLEAEGRLQLRPRKGSAMTTATMNLPPHSH